MPRSIPQDTPTARPATEGFIEGLTRANLWALGVPTFAILTALGAHVAIPLPPDGVPMTLQTLFVVLAALCLGPKAGSMSMGLYVLAGVVGVPMFAGGAVGLEVILGQTGGYLLGFIACQPVVGWIVRGRDGLPRGWLALVAGVLAAHAVVFAIGVPWLAVVRDFTIGRAIEGGLVPFLPGMVAKSIAAVLIGLVVAPWCVRRIW
ncbi:MAG: biotin transporter BioY [Phycisphaeraceae bacterium]|nr:biotin transporter BioY [Phycisphaeraceae bacterium]